MIRTQNTFSNNIRKIYNKCVITGTSVGTDAAHVIDKSVCDKHNNKYLKFHIDNGILLRKDIHQLFDNYVWCFNPFDFIEKEDGKIEISILYDSNKRISNELKKNKYYTVNTNNYLMIYLRYVEFIYKYSNKYNNTFSTDICNQICIVYEDVFSNLYKISKLENNMIYDYDSDTIMILTENLNNYITNTNNTNTNNTNTYNTNTNNTNTNSTNRYNRNNRNNTIKQYTVKI